MKKRILCLLSAVVLLLSLMTISVWAATTVTAVEISVSYPVHLGQPDDFVQVYGTGCKPDTSVNTDGYRNGVRWRKISGGKVMGATDTFVGGELYELSVYLVADSGYSFSVTQTEVTVNMEEASFTIIDDSHIRANIQMCADNLYINRVSVTGLDAPQVGSSLDYSVTVEEDTCSLTDVGHNNCKNGVTWYDGTDGKYVPVGTKAVKEHEYWVEIHLKAKPGYEFPDNVACSVNGQTLEASGIGEEIALVVMFEACTDHRWSPKYHSVGDAGHAYICADCKAYSEIKPHTPGPAATTTTPQTCKECGHVIQPKITHTHSLTLVAEVAPTCMDAGVKAYYTCSGCSERFWDEAAKQAVASDEDLTVSPLGHKISDSWEFDEKTHWRVCEACGEKMTETDMEHEMKDEKCTTCQYEKKKTEETEPEGTTPEAPQKDPKPDIGPEEPQWWMFLLIGAGAVVLGIGAGVVVTVLTKKKK